MAKKAKLNAKQKKFVDFWLLSMNATKAAKQAGYSKKTAYAIGFKLLRKAEIKERIEKRRKKTDELLQFSKVTLLNDLLEVSKRCMQKVPVMVFDHDLKEMIQKTDEETGEGVWEFEPRAVIAAIAEINKMQGNHAAVKTKDVSENPISNIAKKLFGN